MVCAYHQIHALKNNTLDFMVLQRMRVEQLGRAGGQSGSLGSVQDCAVLLANARVEPRGVSPLC